MREVGSLPSVIEAVRQHGPAAIVLPGDVQAQKPLEQELAPILEKSAVWFIHGNHDTDSNAAPQTTVQTSCIQLSDASVETNESATSVAFFLLQFIIGASTIHEVALHAEMRN